MKSDTPVTTRRRANSNGNGNGAPAKTVSALAAVAAIAAATPKPAAARSGKLAAHDPSLDDPIARFLEAKREADRWTALMETAEAQIIERGRELRIAECRRARRLESSIRLNNAVTMTQKAQYCKIDPAYIADMETAFGADAGRYFVQRLKIELTEQSAADENVLAELLRAFGEDGFARIFKTTRTVEVTEQFHHDLTLLPEVEAAARPFLDDETIKPYKPTVRQ
jgi:hypothetical protein